MNPDLMQISQVENTSCTPKIFGILIGCSAAICYKRTKGGSNKRYKGEKKCCNCQHCDMYTTFGSRHEGTPVKKDKYTLRNFKELHDSILHGTVTV